MKQLSREYERGEVAARLRERRAEIEGAILARVHSVSDLPSRGGPEYAAGMRNAVSAAVAYGLEAVGYGERNAPVPDAAFAQARLAARSGVSLDTVLHRYLAGHAIFDDFLIEEAELAGLDDPLALRCLLRSQAASVDRLLVAVSAAYVEEAEHRPPSPECRRGEIVERLLAGEPLNVAELDYDFDGWHLGMLASGWGVRETLASLARSHDARLLVVRRDDGFTWAWLGRRRRLDPQEIAAAEAASTPGLALSLGEPGSGIAAWRLSHRQARVAHPIAQCDGGRVVRYADVALLACALHDELLGASLRRLYLAPLEDRPSSPAAALRVDRKTVTARLRAAEDRLGVRSPPAPPSWRRR